MKTKTVYRIFIFVLVFSPLAFGTVEQWSLTVMESASLLALCLLLLINTSYKDGLLYEVPGMLPLSLFLAFIALQLLPLPPFVLKALSPDTYSIYLNSVWAGGHTSWATLSVSRKATLMEFLRIASYASFYVLTVQLLAKKENLKKVLSFIVLLAAVISFFAILQDLLSNGKIYWFRELTLGGIPFGPYVNRDDYAGLMEMLFPIAMGLFLFNRPYTPYKSLRERISEAFNQHRTNVYLLLGLAVVLIATSVFLCLSRGGIISLSLSMLFFGLLIVNRRKKSRKGALIIVMSALIVLSVGWFGWSPIIERFVSLRNAEGDISGLRPYIWKDCLQIVRHFPLVGSGFGTLADIYPRFRTISAAGVLKHAHNDYLELASEGGIVACVLMGWFLFEVLRRSVSTFRRRREPYSVYVFAGSISGVLAILMHSVTDFNLQIGANGLYFFFLLGLVVSTAHTRISDGVSRATLLERTRLPHRRLAVVFVVALLVCATAVNAGVLVGKGLAPAAKNISMNTRLSPDEAAGMKEAAYRASLFDPLEARYRYEMGNADWLSSERKPAADQYRAAVELDPANAVYLQSLGLALSGPRDDEEAGRLLRAGMDSDISNPAGYRIYASWLLSRGMKTQGMDYMTKAMKLNPDQTRRYITLMVVYGLDNGDIRESLPDLVEPHLSFADYLAGTGRDAQAEGEYITALGYVRNEKVVKPSFYLHVYNYLRKKDKTDDALMVMRMALDALPGDVSVRLAAADAYERAGIHYKAVEEYRKVLMIDPKNATARKKLDQFG